MVGRALARTRIVSTASALGSCTQAQSEKIQEKYLRSE
jgi:hypothetical protein